MGSDDTAEYFTLNAQNPRRMLLSSLKNPSLRDNWLWGKRFVKPPAAPVVVSILPGYEEKELMDYFGTPPVMSGRFYDALVEAGVDNLDVYDAVLSGDGGRIRHTGYKAFNVIGLISAASKDTFYSGDNKSRLLDASIEKLVIDPAAARGALLFRLAEYAGAIVVHRSIKEAIERLAFPHVHFGDPEDLVS
jgi:hypothetical protein